MITIKNLPFYNVAANSVASLELPLGMTFHRIILELGGTSFTKANISRIVAKLNGKIFYDVTGSRLDSINQYRGLTANASYLTIDFSEPFAKTIGGMGGGAIGTVAGVNSFTLEVTIGAATAPTLASYSMLSESRPLDTIMALVHHPVTFSAAGKYPVVLPHGPSVAHLIKRIHFFHSNMTTLEVKKNGLLIFEEITDAVNDFIQTEYNKVPQSGLFVYDPIVTNDLKRVVDTANAQSMQFNVTVSASDTVNIMAEYITLLGNL